MSIPSQSFGGPIGQMRPAESYGAVAPRSAQEGVCAREKPPVDRCIDHLHHRLSGLECELDAFLSRIEAACMPAQPAAQGPGSPAPASPPASCQLAQGINTAAGRVETLILRINEAAKRLEI